MPHQTFLASSMPDSSTEVLRILDRHSSAIASAKASTVPEVLREIEPGLRRSGWRLASGSRSSTGIRVAGTDGEDVVVDGLHEADRSVLWIETGRSWANFGFLQHAIEASFIDIDNVVIGVRTYYNNQPAFDRCAAFLARVFNSGLRFPYQSLVLIGY